MQSSLDHTLVLRNAGELAELADVLEPEESSGEHVAWSPAPVQDFAFADTICLRELPPDEPPPPSGPVIVNDPLGTSQQLTPLPYPLPSPAPGPVDPKGDTVALVIPPPNGPLDGLRQAIRSSVDEMSELWAGTAEVVPVSPGERTRAITLFRRASALWSFWEWDAADFLRAAMIGIAVFLAAACIGASIFGTSAEASEASAEVRGPRTLDQHTPKRVVIRTKAGHTR